MVLLDLKSQVSFKAFDDHIRSISSSFYSEQIILSFDFVLNLSQGLENDLIDASSSEDLSL